MTEYDRDILEICKMFPIFIERIIQYYIKIPKFLLNPIEKHDLVNQLYNLVIKE